MKKILVIDDSGLIRLQLNQILKNAGYEVLEAVTGEQVINDTFHRDYSLKDMDLIILDLYLEDIHGLEVFKSIVYKYPNIPVIILTGESKKENVLKCIEMGAKDYIVKPFKGKELLSRVRKILPLDIGEDTGNNLEEDITKFYNVIINEIDRAIRVKSPLAFVRYRFKGININLEKIYMGTVEELREIDQTFKMGNDILLMLPFTDKEGEVVVSHKLLEAWKEVEKEINVDQMDIKKVFFPDDIEDSKLIENYQKDEIKNIIIKKLNLNSKSKV